MPFAKRCSSFLLQQADATLVTPLMTVTTNCEVEEYGRFRPDSHHGRCSDGDYTQWLTEMGPACCGDDFQFCAGVEVGGQFNGAPMDESGNLVCRDDCRPMAEEMYAECQPRFAKSAGLLRAFESFIAVCHGVDASGGGHRRLLHEDEGTDESRAEPGLTPLL
jgi:hypothetical protein